MSASPFEVVPITTGVCAPATPSLRASAGAATSSASTEHVSEQRTRSGSTPAAEGPIVSFAVGGVAS